MRRRDFVTLLGGTMIWPLAAHAQRPEKTTRIGVLMGIGENDPEAGPRVEALEQGLRELDWVKGRNLQLDYRWTAGAPDSAERFAKDIVGLKPDLIVVHSTPMREGAASTDDDHSDGLRAGRRPHWKRVREKPVAVALLFNPETATFYRDFIRNFDEAAPRATPNRSCCARMR